MTDILVVFGTRPEAIKMAPIVHALKSHGNIDVKICVTAQHREMLDQVLSMFEITPDFDFNIMRNGQDLFDVTSKVILKMRDLLKDISPKTVMVHGDTTTSSAAAMASFYLNVPVAHVEAGLRTHDFRAPFPEEFNRRLTGMISAIHFAPTATSRQNLLNEGVDANDIFVTGNSVIDSLFMALERIRIKPDLSKQVHETIDNHLSFDWRSNKYVLITGHRRENFGHGFLEICTAIADLADAYPNLHFVYPVHFNPNVQDPVQDMLSGRSNIHLIEPLDYFPFVELLNHCHIVLTDSGGIQEEAPSLGKPVLVMRDVTERPEALEAGTVKLVGASRENIVGAIKTLMEEDGAYEKMAKAINPYGDGQACQRIVDRMIDFLRIS